MSKVNGVKKRNVKFNKNGQKTGAFSEYDENIHDKSILEILGEGGFLEDFCKKWDITTQTAYNWRRRSKSFDDSYIKGKEYGRAEWLRKPLGQQSSSFSTSYWFQMLRHMYGWGREGIPELKETKNFTPAQIVDLTIRLVGEGRISDKMIEKMCTIALAKLKIQEGSELEERIKNLESMIKLNTGNHGM